MRRFLLSLTLSLGMSLSGWSSGLCESEAFALPTTNPPASSNPTSTSSPSSTKILPTSLLSEIQRRPSGSFEPLLKSWQTRYGTSVVPSLLQVAAANESTLRGSDDTTRYIALMGAAKMGGNQITSQLLPFLKDRSWMIRAATLRALQALKDPQASQSVIPLLKDPALVVRLEAVDAIERLRPPGSSEALLEVLENSANYHGGKAQWVPQKALSALSRLSAQNDSSQQGASKLAPRLKPLLDHQNDPELQKQTISTLESLTGKVLKPGAPLSDRIREWKLALKTINKTY